MRHGMNTNMAVFSSKTHAGAGAKRNHSEISP